MASMTLATAVTKNNPVNILNHVNRAANTAARPLLYGTHIRQLPRLHIKSGVSITPTAPNISVKLMQKPTPNPRLILIGPYYTTRRVAKARKINERDAMFISHPQQLMGLRGEMCFLLCHDWRTVLGGAGMDELERLGWLYHAKIEEVD